MMTRTGTALASLLIVAGCVAPDDHERAATVGDVYGQVQLMLYREAKDDAAGGQDAYVLQLRLPPRGEDPDCGVFSLEATLNGIAMEPIGQGGYASGTFGDDRSLCVDPSYQLPAHMLGDVTRIEVVARDATGSIQARFEQLPPPKVAWLEPADGRVCLGDEAIVKLSPAPSAEDLMGEHSAEPLEIDYRYDTAEGSGDELLPSQWQKDRATLTVTGIPASQGTLNVMFWGWQTGRDASVCKGASTCSGPFPFRFAAELPMEVVDCTTE